AIVSSQDHGHKNFYVHRDTPGSGDWTIFPWDVDLTFGRNWTDSSGYFTDTIYTNNVLNFYNSAQQGKPANRLYNLIFQHPEFRRMYLRRLRTVMDTVLQPPETPPAERGIDARIRALLDLLDPPDVAKSDADLDEAKWVPWGAPRTTRAEAQRILDVYLPGRRNFLFKSPNATLNGERIPDAQAAQVAVHLDELDFNPLSGRQAEEFVRLTNAEPVAVDVSGWRLQGQVHHTFRPGTVIPAGRTLYVSPEVAAFRNRTTSPKRGENVFVQGNYDGQLSARGGTVELLNAAGNVVSSLSYPGAPTPLQDGLRLSEVMFHPIKPPTGSPYDAEDFEFIELKNVSSQPLNLWGAQFNEGVTFVFTNSAAATLDPSSRILIVKSRAAFESRYGVGLPVAGEYVGSLANEGESIRLQDAVGETVFEFRYDPIWFTSADGGGRSLEPISPEVDLDLERSWHPTAVAGGTPGKTSWTLPIESFSEDDTGRLVVRARAEAGNNYRLEGASRLDLSAWDPLTPARSGPEQSLLEFSIPTPSVETQYFLRVKPE
ncbi:MAG TPA: hypothetical protein DCE44_25835, partial [Verrucomicrobiales bacterium]|nr:hypothetical protein [Verrucomicrobiales bacterium]